MTEQKLDYNKSYIDVLETLSAVNPRIKVVKNGDKLTIMANNQSSNFCYILEAPVSYFNMPVNEIGFIDFNRFKKFYEAMSSKTVTSTLSVNVDDDGSAVDMIFKNEVRSDKLTLRLGDTTLPTFDSSFHELAEHNQDVAVEFDEETINELQRKISIIGADYIDVTANENVLNFNVYTMRSADRADYPIFLNQPAAKSFSLKFTADTLNLLPKGKYKIDIDADGCLVLVQEREDDIKLQIMLLAEE